MLPAVRGAGGFHSRTAGGDVATSPGLQSDLRVVGAAGRSDPPGHGEERVLEVSEDQRAHRQRHVETRGPSKHRSDCKHPGRSSV